MMRLILLASLLIFSTAAAADPPQDRATDDATASDVSAPVSAGVEVIPEDGGSARVMTTEGAIQRKAVEIPAPVFAGLDGGRKVVQEIPDGGRKLRPKEPTAPHAKLRRTGSRAREHSRPSC